MKYACLAFVDDEQFKVLQKRQAQALDDNLLVFDEELRTRGYIAAQTLQPARSAGVARIRNRKRVITDGPFAETKEQAGAFVARQHVTARQTLPAEDAYACNNN